MVVLIIFPVILQTVINLIMLSIGGQLDSTGIISVQFGHFVHFIHKLILNGDISSVYFCHHVHVFRDKTNVAIPRHDVPSGLSSDLKVSVLE